MQPLCRASRDAIVGNRGIKHAKHSDTAVGQAAIAHQHQTGKQKLVFHCLYIRCYALTLPCCAL